jgi:hypothetical protein
MIRQRSCLCLRRKNPSKQHVSEWERVEPKKLTANVIFAINN